MSGLGLTKGTVSRQIDAAAAAGLMTVQQAPTPRREKAEAVPPDELGQVTAALQAVLQARE